MRDVSAVQYLDREMQRAFEFEDRKSKVLYGYVGVH